MALSARWRAALLTLGGIGLLTMASVAVVGADEQAVVLRLGTPDRVVNRFAPGNGSGNSSGSGAGLIAHIPFAERVVRLDRQLVTLNAPDLTVRTRDQHQLHLDLIGTYRVIDPVRAVRTAGNQERLSADLAALLPGLVQAEFGALDAAALPLPGASGAWQRVTAALDRRARPLGVQVVDVRVRRAALPEGEAQAALNRMKDEREAQALAISDGGLQQALQIRSEAEVEAARIIGASAGRDGEFYDFYRAMNSYETMFGDPNRKNRATLILSPDSAYLRQMNGRPAGR